MERIALLVLATFLSWTASYSQEKNPVSVEAKILYEKKVKNQVTIKSSAINKGDRKVQIGYELVMTKEDTRGNKLRNQQGGDFEIEAEDTTIMSSSTVDFDENGRLEVILKIFQDKKLIDSDTMSFGALKLPEDPVLNLNKRDKPNTSEFEIGGIIVDNTRTRMGRDFYDLFYSGWEDPKGVGDFIIRIEEFPGRFRSTRLVVWLDDDKLVETNLQSSYDYLESLSGYTINRLQSQLRKRRQNQQNLNEDLRDTGI